MRIHVRTKNIIARGTKCQGQDPRGKTIRSGNAMMKVLNVI